MSPRRLDPSIVEVRLRSMSDLLDDLSSVPEDVDLTTERMVRHGVERILTQLVELAASINEHVAGDVLGRAARTYRDSFALAAECGLVDGSLRDELLGSVGLRNVLVHEYLDVDLAQVRAAIPRALDGYRRYVRQVAAFVAALD